MMNNNDIFKKLRVALQLRDDQIVEIMELVDFRMSKGEVGNIFRNPDHPNFIECGDQVLRNFLNGLVIHLRGTKEDPKNAADVIAANAEAVKAQPKLPREGDSEPKKPAQPRPRSQQGPAKSGTSKPGSKKPFKKFNDKPKSPVENVKFTIKKKK